MALAVEKAKETGAELVLASDPDGDRLGVGLRNNEGEITLINGNEICTLMTYYSIMRRKELGDLRENDYVVKTIVTTELIREIANRNEVTLYDVTPALSGLPMSSARTRVKNAISAVVKRVMVSCGRILFGTKVRCLPAVCLPR
ncbi:Phosphoglucomutase [Porphyromonas macacae]|uniref:Phosphoglucomutase n=1 Tax=Porphyromonas macacae TaxID=28115 RepID=A0A379EG79_9PORP|nr:Phosphoglucomutase [Porphyromonas macacae]